MGIQIHTLAQNLRSYHLCPRPEQYLLCLIRCELAIDRQVLRSLFHCAFPFEIVLRYQFTEDQLDFVHSVEATRACVFTETEPEPEF